ncbi:MAG TPA: bacterial transcriptional activator domain-containing protein [Acidimicrobiales bacterium]|nr:bacterial transcriptional activator domain-containing protein [Acidimicrobiales bacterium]
MPALVTLGGTGRTKLLVDLEQMGSVALEGSDAGRLLENMIVELCSLPWSETTDLVVVGFPSQLQGFDRVRQAPSVAALVREVKARLAARPVVSSPGATRISDERWTHDEASLDPLVIACLAASAEEEPRALDELLDLVTDGGAGLAVVLAGRSSQARWRVVADGGPLELSGPSDDAGAPASQQSGILQEAHGQFVAPVIPPAFLSKADALVAVTNSPAVAAPAGTPSSLAMKGVRRGSGLTSDHSAEVEVRMLGPIGVIGAAKPFSRAWALELVVYLATHPSTGATNEQWQTALWPDKLLAPATLHSIASSARRALGVAQDGRDHLPRSHGRLCLGPSVSSDWARFQELSRSDDADDWEDALAMVRGRPFLGMRSQDWAILEGISATIEATVVDLATRFAEGRIVHGDFARSELAVRQALRIAPYDERLYRVLLRTADAAGNPAGIETVMSELLTLVAEDVEPFDAVHPETWDLYRSLSRRSSIRRGA